MPYVYEVSFDVSPDKVSSLQIGESLQRLVAYMKVRLPSEPGFVVADAVYSIDDADTIRVVLRSEWTDWADIERHRASSLVEDKVLEEFEPHIEERAMTLRRYAQVGSGPYAARQ